MNEFKLRRARLGAWVRYLNVPLLFWFASDVPMPFDKQLLVGVTAAKLAANVVFHLHLEITRRYLVSSYLILAFEMMSTCLSLYVTGLAASPFLLIFPLHAFSAFYVDFSRRATLQFGGLGMVMLAGTYAIWWSTGPAPIIWDPHAYTQFVWVVCLVQLLILTAYVFLATETNPLVEELARREQVLLRQAHRAELGTSLSMIAHELRNPLTTIQFSLEAVERAARAPGADPRLQKASRIAGEELARISGMIQSVLAYARERRDRMQPEDHRPADLVERAVDFLKMKWGRNHRTFTVEAALADAPMVRCDADAMHQVLVNLLDNAIQHVAGDRPLRIEVRHALRENRVAIIVRDNGTGIPEARLARLFEGFVTDREGGTGLGMLISRQLLEDQGGSIEVTSVEGAGTTIIVLLPLGGAGAPRTVPDDAADPEPGTAAVDS